YTPTAGYTGPDSFTYKANDGTVDSPPATVALTVIAGNVLPVAQPVAQNDHYTTPHDQALVIAAPGVLGNDTRAATGGGRTAAKVSGPSHGAVTLNADGSFTYTPAPHDKGPDSFTYKANNGAADSNIATVTIAVTGTTDGPLAVNESYSLMEDTALPVPAPGVVGNDVSGPPLMAVLVTAPLHGTLSLNIVQPDGSFTYAPAPNFNGPDSFTYKANDGTTDSQNVATVGARTMAPAVRSRTALAPVSV